MTDRARPGPSASRKRPWLRKYLFLIAGVYFFALAASYYQRYQLERSPVAVPTDKLLATVSVVRGDHAVPGQVSIAYRDLPGDNAEHVPVVLIHGSPGSGDVLELLAGQIQGPRRLVIPDLPGFGDSSHNLPDYSFRAHAVYAWELLDHLGIRRAHLVGFSMGGGVVLNMAQLAPERVESVTMLSSINVQEMELLGDYYLNHTVHGVQLAGLEALKIGLPRFGEFNRSEMGVPYARNFYDSDQRPLRSILQSYAGPMLILHGREDPLVPVEAAKEANRLVPQSEIHILPSNHFMVFQDPVPLEPFLIDFWGRVESGRAVTRTSANPDRVILSQQPMDKRHLPKPGFVTAAVLFITLALATFVSEDLACISAGVLVAEGSVSFLFATLACFLGIFCGDILLFILGRFLGRAAVNRAPLRWLITPGALERASEWLERNGAITIATSRFVPGTRLPTYVAAGVLHTPARKFLFYFFIAAAVWTPLIVGLSAGLGMPLMHYGFFPGKPLSLNLLAVAAGIFLLVRLVLKLASYRRRRKPA